MKELLEYIVKNILGESTKINIEETSEDETTTVYHLNLPDEQKGLIIGKSGRNIRSIRDVVNIRAKEEGRRIFIKIVD